MRCGIGGQTLAHNVCRCMPGWSYDEYNTCSTFSGVAAAMTARGAANDALLTKEGGDLPATLLSTTVVGLASAVQCCALYLFWVLVHRLHSK